MSVKVSARLPEEVIEKINGFEGETFSEKLVAALLSDTENIVSDNEEKINLNKDQAKFLIGFLHLYEGSFVKWWTLDEDFDSKVLFFIRNILLELGDNSFPVPPINNISLNDIKNNINHDYSYLTF